MPPTERLISARIARASIRSIGEAEAASEIEAVVSGLPPEFGALARDAEVCRAIAVALWAKADEIEPLIPAPGSPKAMA